MVRYPTHYLEVALNINRYREEIAKAHTKRMAIEDRKMREKAKLSDFLPIEIYTHAWFIHNVAGIPICRSWPAEEEKKPTHHVEGRYRFGTVFSSWEPIMEIASCTAGALHDYLREKTGREPTLNPVGWGQRIVEDEEGNQYRFVSMPTLRVPTPHDLEELVKFAVKEKSYG